MSKKKALDPTGGSTNEQPSAEVLKIPQTEYLLSLTANHDKFKDQLGKAYVRFKTKGHFEIHPLRSEAYKNYLIHELYLVHKDKIDRGAVERVITIIDSEIISTDVIHELYIRVERSEDGRIIAATPLGASNCFARSTKNTSIVLFE